MLSEMGKRAVFLDRDGVLNRATVCEGKPYAPRCLQEFELLADALPATMALRKAGLIIVVVTNQPDVGNGLVHKSVVEEMHDCLRGSVPVDAIKVCYHGQKDNCICRKPRTAMLEEAARELDLDLPGSFMVGDRWSDMEAGKRQGCYTILIDRGYSEALRGEPDVVVGSLTDAVGVILTELSKGTDVKT
jgi:D-glycero-D-manno-heptose 1,7-bisphosphate phosphatase